MGYISSPGKYFNKEYKESWFIAAISGDAHHMLEIFEYIKDVNIVDEKDTTALTYTCANGRLDAFNFLITKENININYQNKRGWTALMNTAQNYYDDFRRNQIIETLVSHPKIDFTLKNIYNHNFLDCFNTNNYREILRDYYLQKEIAKNNEYNILLLNQYGLVHPKIKDEYSNLFEAKSWGLIV